MLSIASPSGSAAATVSGSSTSGKSAEPTGEILYGELTPLPVDYIRFEKIKDVGIYIFRNNFRYISCLISANDLIINVIH